MRRSTYLAVLQAVSSAVTVTGMIVTPLARQRGGVRRAMSNVVVGGLFTATTAAACRRWGARRALPTAGGVAVATAAIERAGTATGVPFGRYAYTPALRPQVAGVPAVVPLAWFAMALPAREAAHAALGRHSSPVRRVLLGSAALTAWDLFLDPQMVGEGYWRWVRVGRYRGIPLSNFAGWFVVGLGVMAVLEAALPVDPVLRSLSPADDEIGRPLATQTASGDTLVAEYAVMAAMETLGFAVFFGDPLVAAVGGSAMLPIAAAASRRLLFDRRHWRRR